MHKSLDKALERIKKERLVPSGRSMIVLARAWRWLLVAAFLILGALSLAAALQLSWDMDWDGRALAAIGPGGFLRMIPYFWIAVLAAFFTLLFAGVRKTENGYRIRSGALWEAALFSLAAAGLVWAMLDGGRIAHRAMLRIFPAYEEIAYTKEKQWSQPERGMLAGTVRQVRSQDAFVLDDLSGKRWEVALSEETLVRPMAKIGQGEKVKIIGKVSKDGFFDASEIRPWEGRGLRHGEGDDFQRGQGRGMGRMREK